MSLDVWDTALLFFLGLSSLYSLLTGKSTILVESVTSCGLLVGFKYYCSMLECRSKNEADESIENRPKGEYVVLREGF